MMYTFEISRCEKCGCQVADNWYIRHIRSDCKVGIHKEIEMSKKNMHVSFVLDETGSMQSVKEQTISGFNEYIETLRKDKAAKQMRFTLTKFNSDKVEIAHRAVELGEVALLNDETYQPAALTPLYDAIGRTIRVLEKEVNGKDTALIVIQTDGQENHSKEFTRDGIFSLITEKKNAGWTFAFLGADQDAWIASQALGIDKGNTMSYAGQDTSKAFHRVATASVAYVSMDAALTRSFFDKEK